MKSGRKVPVGFFVVNLEKNDFEIIIGTDVLQEDCRLNCKGTIWTITIGKRVHKIIGMKNAAEISTNGVTVEKRGTYKSYEGQVRRLYRDIFSKDGEPLTATGRATHKLETITSDFVYVKPYRQTPRLRSSV